MLSVGIDSNFELEIDWQTQCAIGGLQLASYLTDPVCEMHRCWREIDIVAARYPTEHDLSLLARQCLLALQIGAWGLLAMITTVIGVAIRALVVNLQEMPFIQTKNNTPSKNLENNIFSVLSWNAACVAGGYSISDGGVTPWRERIDRIVAKIIQQNADVNCIYEIFDHTAAEYMAEQLHRQGWKYVIRDIGKQSIGVCSGMLIASKFEVENPTFNKFPEYSLIGRTKHAAKGVFMFNLIDAAGCFATIAATHLQHSEEPQYASDLEIVARDIQMQIVIDQIKDIQDRLVIVTGDLNLDDREYQNASWHRLFIKKDLYLGFTWGGDQFCASLTAKRPSQALNLDHTLVFNNGVNCVFTTELVNSGFDGTVFRPGANSDHGLLYSRFTIESACNANDELP